LVGHDWSIPTRHARDACHPSATRRKALCDVVSVAMQLVVLSPDAPSLELPVDQIRVDTSDSATLTWVRPRSIGGDGASNTRARDRVERGPVKAPARLQAQTRTDQDPSRHRADSRYLVVEIRSPAIRPSARFCDPTALRLASRRRGDSQRRQRRKRPLTTPDVSIPLRR
jgi:hypothetical protein